MKKLHFGIIGAGRIGRVHAETLAFRLPEAEALAIADVNAEAAQALAARCNIPKVTVSADEIFADPQNRGRADLLLDQHPRGYDCAGRQGRQAHFLRKADRFQPGAN